MNDKVIAVVVTFNRKELLTKVIDALLIQSYPVHKILIIDNDSKDGTGDLCKSFAISNSNVVYTNTGANLGGAGGFNYGMQAASAYDYDRLWLMDDDLVPDVDCLQSMLSNDFGDIIQPVRSNVDGSCAEISPVIYDLKSPYIINPKRSTVQSYISKFKGKFGCMALELHGIPFEGPLIKKDVIDKIGLPNKNYFIFYDDLDFSVRARAAGFSIFCDLSANATRLLINNQQQDLKSWKGYFMLRNLFHILWRYGDNVFVRYRPLAIVCAYFFISLKSLDFKQMSVVFRAYIDSFNLANSDKNKP